MNDVPLWATLLIGLLGGGAVFGLIQNITSQILTSRSAGQQKRTENMLQNTRQYIDTLYIPINIRLTKLVDCYSLYKANKSMLNKTKKYRKDDESLIALIRQNTKQAFEDFLQAYKDYIKLMKEITDQGRDAYLTMDFNERLRSFTQFMEKASLEGWVLLAPESYNAIDLPLKVEGILFSRRFSKDIYFLKSYIKGVTLGTTRHN